MMQMIGPNDRMCPSCGADTLRHDPYGTEYLGPHTEEMCLRRQLAKAREEVALLRREYAVKHAENEEHKRMLSSAYVRIATLEAEANE